MNQARFQKQQREKARRERAAAKSDRREERRQQGPARPAVPDAQRQARVLGELAELHRRYDAGGIQLEEFLQAKEDLTQRLDVR